MNQIDFYKDLFDKENIRRQEVISSLNIPFTVISALATALYLFLTNFDYSKSKILSTIFSGFVFCSLSFLLISIYYLTRSFIDVTKKYEYMGLPYPKKLYEWHQNLSEYYKDEEDCEQIINSHFEKYLTENYIELINYNMNTNDSKFAFIFNSKKFLVFSLCSTILTIIPYCVNFFQKEKVAHRVEIVNKDLRIFRSDSTGKIKTANTNRYEQTRPSTTALSTTKSSDKGRPTAAKTTPNTFTNAAK